MPEGERAGFPTHWQRLSDGPAPALLLHCALAWSGAYGALADALSDRLAITAPDMPGHGRSGTWDNRGDMHDCVTAIAETFLTDGCHLIGHSFGATVALRLAQSHPDRVASLTLIEPVLFAAARGSDLHRQHMAATADVEAAMNARDWTLAARRFTAKWGDGRAWETLPNRQRQGFIDRIALVAATQEVLNDDTAGLLRPGRPEAIRCPVLLLRGDRTMPVMAAIHAALADRLSDATEIVIEGAGHMLPLTHAKDVAGPIARLVDRAPTH